MVNKTIPDSSPTIVQDESFKDLLGPKYRNALFIGVCLSAIQQFTGINGVVFNSNGLFTNGKSGIAADQAARIGTFFIGVTGFLGTGLSIYASKHLGRKTLMVFGEFEMMINLAGIALCSFYDYQTLLIILTNVFIFVFNATIGPGLWSYTPEILPSAGMS